MNKNSNLDENSSGIWYNHIKTKSIFAFKIFNNLSFISSNCKYFWCSFHHICSSIKANIIETCINIRLIPNQLIQSIALIETCRVIFSSYFINIIWIAINLSSFSIPWNHIVKWRYPANLIFELSQCLTSLFNIHRAFNNWLFWSSWINHLMVSDNRFRTTTLSTVTHLQWKFKIIFEMKFNFYYNQKLNGNFGKRIRTKLWLTVAWWKGRKMKLIVSNISLIFISPIKCEELKYPWVPLKGIFKFQKNID